MKHCCIISPISTALTHLELPPPALSFCASHTTPAPYFPGLTPPCPHRHKLQLFVLDNLYIEFLLIAIILLYIRMVFYTIENYFTRYPDISNSALETLLLVFDIMSIIHMQLTTMSFSCSSSENEIKCCNYKTDNLHSVQVISLSKGFLRVSILT